MNDTMKALPERLLIPLSMVVAIVGGAVWLNNKLVNIEFELRAINARIGFVEQKVEEATEDRWTSKDMRHWASLLQALNEKLKVPEATTEQYRGIDAGGTILGER